MSDLKDLKADSSTLSGWMAQAWASLKQSLMVGAFAAGILITFFNWYRETFPQPEAATAEQVQGQVDEMKTEMAMMATQVVNNALESYNDSLQVVRRNIEDSVARPVFKAILDLDRRLNRLERGQQATNTALEVQRATEEASTRELLDRVSDDTKQQRILEALERFEERLDGIERGLPKGKTTKQKF